MQSATLPRKYLAFASIAIVTFFIFSSNKDSTPQKLIWNAYQNGINPSLKKDVFSFPPVDSQAIRDICSATNWNQSLIFKCDDNVGGVGIVRNSILNCVRYTIAAGGSLVLPRIHEREIADQMGSKHEPLTRRDGAAKWYGLDYMFDVKHFSESLKRSCPELVLVQSMDEKANKYPLSPESLFPNIPTSGLEHPEEWPQRLNEWIETKVAPASISEENPLIIDLEPSFLHYPTHSDGHAVAHIFGNILKFRSDIRELATNALETIVDWYDFEVNITRHGLLKPSFLAVHLNTANPILQQRHAIDIKYSHFAAQSQAYLGLSSELNLPIIYAAAGNIEIIEDLALDAKKKNIAVTYKEDLLEKDDIEKLNGLTYDQRALVDYLILTKAEAFVGVGHSPYSWNIALAREQFSAVMEGQLDGDIWKDGMNTLFGVRPDYVESSACMWS